MSNSSPPDRHAPPHIRLNSGNEDLLNAQQQSSSPSRPPNPRAPTSRSLMPQSQPSSRPGTGRMAVSGTPLYQSQTQAESSERLLPPRKGKPRKFRDDDSVRSATPNGGNSRRTSWSSSSDRSRDSQVGLGLGGIGAGVSPFDDSRTPSRAGSDDEGVNTQTVSEKYNIMPSAGLLLFPEDVEKDDWLHTPDPNERDRMQWSDLFSKRGLVNVGGLAFITIGILILFIGYPVLTFVQRIVDKGSNDDTCAKNPLCLNSNAPLLQNVRQGLIDPDTPSSAMSRTSSKGDTQTLVFSDEFNTPGRTFYPDDDPYWEGVNLWYGATHDIEWYDPDAITTQNGYLSIRFDAFQNHGLNYRSGMLQSWNKMCFKGGTLEASLSLPGRGDTSGFWPGFWAMGNLGRPGYMATSDGMWPYSYHDECDAGITPNQSDTSGISSLPGMRLPACTCVGQDSPSPGISRSAPEIDAIEATVTYLMPPAFDAIGQASQSFQMAPFDVFWRPNTEFIEVYDRSITMANTYQGGPFQEALSAVTNLNNGWYNGIGYQSYAFEYEPGSSGYITWYVGDTPSWSIDAKAIGPNGNIGQRVMPEEPMSVVVNFGMAANFAPLNFSGLAPLFPAYMRIDYIRIYQDESDHEITCDPEGYETTTYIAQHPEAYQNPNHTKWTDAGYSWPSNSYQDGCQAETSYRREKRSERKRRRKEKRAWLPWKWAQS